MNEITISVLVPLGYAKFFLCLWLRISSLYGFSTAVYFLFVELDPCCAVAYNVNNNEL